MHPLSNCPVSESQTWNWHCLLLRSKTMKPAWSQVQMSLIFTANFPKAAVKHTISMKPTWIEYLWVSLQTDFNDLFYRQTLDEFSEIQKLSREVPSLPPVSKFLSFLSLLRNVRRQSQRSWRRSWRALRAQPKRFCCLALPVSTLPLISGWPGYQLWGKETGGAEDHQPESRLSGPVWCTSCRQILW